MKKYVLVILLLLLMAPPIRAEILFSDNFDAYTWNTDNSKDGTECGGSSHPCSGGNTPPTNWSAYRAMTSTSGGGYVGSLPSSQVDHTLGTTSGHAFTALYGGTPNTSDNDISKYLGAEYTELWVSFYTRSSGETSVTGAGDKTFRALNLETACDNYNEFFSGGCGAPIFVYNHTGSSSGTGTWKGSFRCDPQASNYYCDTDYDTNDTQAWSPSGIGWKDGNWHKLKFYLKMNTSAGVSDGIARVYIDDTQVMNKTNIEWRESGTNASGWNYISIGGNTPEGTSPEAWQAFDDLIVATTEAEVDGEADETAPTVTSAAVNGSTVTVNFDETVVTTGYDAGDFNLDCSTAGNDIALSSPSGSGASRTFTSASAIQYGDTCNLDYVGSTDDIEDGAGNDLATFSNTAVENSTEADTTPDAFSFTDITGATISTQYTSNQITVAGINGSAAVTITGGTYSKNSGGYTSDAGTAALGDTFTVRHTSSGSYSTATNTVLTIGGVSDTYTTTTGAEPASTASGISGGSGAGCEIR